MTLTMRPPVVFVCVAASSWLLFLGRCRGVATEWTSKDDPKPCLFGGKTYPRGHRFRPYPCTTCKCNRGHVTCSVEDCQQELNCLRHTNETSPSLESCCPKCSEYGCRHTDGVLYRPGQVISQDNCARCYCPPAGGHSTCDVTNSCPPTLCVDFEHKAGSCCPRCPRGANCQHGLRIIPRGNVLHSDNATCRCRLKRRGSNFKLEANCIYKHL